MSGEQRHTTTPETCANFFDRDKRCLFNNRDWSVSIRPKRCLGCPEGSGAEEMSERRYAPMDTVALMELRCDFGKRQDAIRREIRDRVVSATILDRLDLDPRDIRQYYDELYDKATGDRRRG